MKTKLTSTRLAGMRKCPRLHYWRYELGLARVRQATPLRFGSLFHKGLELRHSMAGQLAEDALASILQAVLAEYDAVPDWADRTEWTVERETLGALLSGHIWRYGQDDLQFVAVEQAFELPLVNPDSGALSRTFSLAGKIDAIVRLPDGRLAVLEYKTAGEDIAPDSEYWLRLRCDGQISLYVLAARAMGYDVATVLYDVTRKPTIRLRQKETPEAFGQRLLADIAERPGFYYQRREVPRLEDDLVQFRAELWQQAQQLLDLRRRASHLTDPATAHFRNVGRMTCGYCDFADLCLSGARVDPASPPAGYQVLPDVNPELCAEGA